MNTITEPNTINEDCIDACNKLLRGELSAIETYTQAIARVDASSDKDELERIRSEHEDSARLLHDHVRSMGGEPSAASGLWGAVAQTIQGTAGLFGESAGLKSLEEGEQHGIREYEEALASDHVMSSIKSVIRGELLPRLREHISTLTAMREDRGAPPQDPGPGIPVTDVPVPV